MWLCYSTFLSTGKFKIKDLIEFDLNKYTRNNSKGCVLEVDLEYPKDLRELHNDYSFAPEKIEIKKEILYKYQLMISDIYNIPIGNVRKLVLSSFDKKKYVLYCGNLEL